MGTYEPYEGLGDYNPGNLLSLQVGADTKKDQFFLSASLVFSTYATDKLDGNKVLRPGRQFEIRLSGDYGGEKYALGADVRYLLRGRNTRYDRTETMLEQLRLYGNEFGVNGRVSWYLDEVWSVAPSVQLRVIGANEYDFDASTIIGLGADVARSIGEGVDLGVGLKYFTGSADGGDIDLSGYQLSANLMASF
jgi:hypothetical protein